MNIRPLTTIGVICDMRGRAGAPCVGAMLSDSPARIMSYFHASRSDATLAG